MKQINFSSTFKANFNEVKDNFNKDLFNFLLPKVIPNKILRYDGNQVGDEIHIDLAGVKWISKISACESTDEEFYFIDVGEKLPLPLKKWHHKHRILKVDDQEVTIVDEISFDCGNAILNNLFYPVLYAQFVPRISQYKKYFENRLYEK